MFWFWYFCRDCFSKKHKRWSVAKDLYQKSSISLFCWFHADGKRDSFPARKNEKILKLDQAKRDDVGFFGQNGLFKSLLTLSLLVYLDFFLTTWYSKICQMEAMLKKLHFPYRSILNHLRPMPVEKYLWTTVTNDRGKKFCNNLHTMSFLLQPLGR